MRVRVLAAALVAASVLVAQPASAQLGGLVKKAKKAAGDAVTPFTPNPAPEYNDDVLMITETRYAALEKGLRAEIAAAKTAEKELEAAQKDAEKAAAADAEAQRKYDEEMKKYNAEMAAWESRRAQRDKLEEEYERKQLAYEKCMDDIEAANDKDAELAEKLLEEGKIMEANAVAQRIRKRIESCGAPPRPVQHEPDPEAPKSPASKTSGMPGTVAELTRKKGEEASGMKSRAYAIMRERWIDYCRSDGRPSMGFSESEIDVLKANKNKCAELMGGLDKARIL